MPSGRIRMGLKTPKTPGSMPVRVETIGIGTSSLMCDAICTSRLSFRHDVNHRITLTANPKNHMQATMIMTEACSGKRGLDGIEDSLHTVMGSLMRLTSSMGCADTEAFRK